jgi:hypothetical protein
MRQGCSWRCQAGTSRSSCHLCRAARLLQGRPARSELLCSTRFLVQLLFHCAIHVVMCADGLQGSASSPAPAEHSSLRTVQICGYSTRLGHGPQQACRNRSSSPFVAEAFATLSANAMEISAISAITGLRDILYACSTRGRPLACCGRCGTCVRADCMFRRHLLQCCVIGNLIRKICYLLQHLRSIAGDYSTHTHRLHLPITTGKADLRRGPYILTVLHQHSELQTSSEL